MNRVTLTLSTVVLAFVVSLGSSFASARHGDGLLRVNIPIHEQGPDTIKLRRLIKHHRHLDLDDYALKAVVLKNGRFSSGYASLRVGDRRSERFYLPGREYIRIPAPSRAHDDWRLRLGPGTQVQMITAILEPRHRRTAAYRYNNPYNGRSHSHRHHASTRSAPYVGAGLAWSLHDGDSKRAKKHSRQLKRSRQELAETRSQLKRTERKLEQVRSKSDRAKQDQQAREPKTRDRKVGRFADRDGSATHQHGRRHPS